MSGDRIRFMLLLRTMKSQQITAFHDLILEPCSKRLSLQRFLLSKVFFSEVSYHLLLISYRNQGKGLQEQGSEYPGDPVFLYLLLQDCLDGKSGIKSFYSWRRTL